MQYASSSDLLTLNLPYMSYEGAHKSGTLVVHKHIAEPVKTIFTTLYHQGFPIAGMTPIDAFDNDDNASMAANNTVAFHAREIVGGGKPSLHAYGLAIDINPKQNPYIKNDVILPEDHTSYDPQTFGAITPEVVALFKEHGFVWGGDWTSLKDYMHFSWYKVGDIVPGRGPEV